MVEKVDWLQNGLTYSAEDDRRLITGLLDLGAAFKPTGGVVADPFSANLKVVQRAAGANMSVDVGAGQAIVTGTENADQGGYVYTNTAVLNLTLTAANATNPRIDAIVVRVKDSVYSGAVNSAALEVVAGTPAASPSVPAIPANSLVIAHVLVPANDTTITNDQIADRRTYQLLKGQGVQSAFRNVLRNGDMTVWQRDPIGGGPLTTYNGTVPMLSDGWIVGGTGGTVSHGRSALPLGNISGIRSAYNITPAGQAAAGDNAQIIQKVEGVDTLAGQVVTLSFYAQANAGTPKLGIEVTQDFGAGGAPSATVQVAVGTVQISTTLARYQVTFTIPSITGKTRGTNGGDFLSVGLWISAGSTFAARASSIGLQNFGLTITGLQLEAGPSATPFERLPYSVQLALCQRYFYTIWSSGTNSILAWGAIQSATQAYFFVPLPVEMRITPGFSYGGGASGVGDLVSVYATSGYVQQVGNSNRNLAAFTGTIAGATAFRPCIMQATTATLVHIDFIAEL